MKDLDPGEPLPYWLQTFCEINEINKDNCIVLFKSEKERCKRKLAQYRRIGRVHASSELYRYNALEAVCIHYIRKMSVFGRKWRRVRVKK